jgi:hypothetical protein
MRTLTVRFLAPGSDDEYLSLDLLNLVQNEAVLRLSTHEYRSLPPRDVLNDVFKRGSGDDGFFPMTWEPFTIDVHEYEELAARFNKARKKK